MKAFEQNALHEGLAPNGLEHFHRTLTAAIQQGFDQVFGFAVVLALLGVMAALLVPRRLSRPSDEALREKATHHQS